MTRAIEARVIDANFVLGEAVEAADAVTGRCGSGNCPQWEEWFALLNAVRTAVRLLDPDSALNRLAERVI